MNPGTSVGVLSTWQQDKTSFLDPRTKLILLITFPTFLMGGAGGEQMQPFSIAFLVLTIVLLMMNGNIQIAVTGTFLSVIAEVLWRYTALYVSAAWYIVLFILHEIILRIVPCVLVAMYTLRTTSVSEFVAGMEKLKISRLITIPLSVMFRFFPTVREEAASINQAMRMRGIRFGREKTSKIFEYRIIPVMMCSLRIGEELSAAALTRGLGAPVKRTNICRIGFHVQDLFIIVLCASAFLVWGLEMVGVTLWLN